MYTPQKSSRRRSIRPLLAVLFGALIFGGLIGFLAPENIPFVEQLVREDTTFPATTMTRHTSPAPGSVNVYFDAIEYFPNLKSKLGVASNAKNIGLEKTTPHMETLGINLFCSNVEFDYWYKSKGADGTNQALAEVKSNPDEPNSQPIALTPEPTPYFKNLVTDVGDRNIATLVQLTGAPAQYLPTDADPSVIRHPAPTNVAESARLVAQWTDASHYTYPILWSVWNEPGHTLLPTRKALGKRALYLANRDNSIDIILDLYANYEPKIMETTAPYSAIGLASFLGGDFKAEKLTSQDTVYFNQFYTAAKARGLQRTVDFYTFNSFGGQWPLVVRGSRHILAQDAATTPIIFTQYAPRSIKVNDDGESTEEGKAGVTPAEASVEMLRDLVQFNSTPDIKQVCLSYWLGGKYGLLTAEKDGEVVENHRYQAVRLLQELPTTRVTVDLSLADIPTGSISAVAGVAGDKSAVMVWNNTNEPIILPLHFVGLPEGFYTTPITMTIERLKADESTTKKALYTDEPLTLAPFEIAVVTLSQVDGYDTNARRASLGTAEFMSSDSTVYRRPVSCGSTPPLPGVAQCGETSGTYGTYDSVRGSVHLGIGRQAETAQTSAVYRDLPAQVYVTAHEIKGSFTTKSQLRITADFPNCTTAKPITTILTDRAGAISITETIDFTAIPVSCRTGASPVRLTFDYTGSVGDQLELYVGADEAEIDRIHDQQQRVIPRVVSTDTTTTLDPGLLTDI